MGDGAEAEQIADEALATSLIDDDGPREPDDSQTVLPSTLDKIDEVDQQDSVPGTLPPFEIEQTPSTASPNPTSPASTILRLLTPNRSSPKPRSSITASPDDKGTFILLVGQMVEWQDAI